MRIVFLSTFYPFRGGIAQFNALLYRELEKGNEVKAYTFKRQYPDILFPGQTQYVSEEDNADKIPAERILDTVNPFSYFKTARKIRYQSPDILITKYWMTFFAPSLGYVLGKSSKKTIRISILDNVVPHEKRIFDTLLNKYFLKRNDGFVVMSDNVLKDLLEIRPDAKYLRIDHPVYDQFGERLDKKEALEFLNLSDCREKKILLFFGIIRDYKGLDLLIQAMSDLNEDYVLIIAGEVYGSFRKYDEIIRENNLQNRIKLFNRYIADDEVKYFFSSADVCILPYKSATQSGIISISKHFEIPVIVTDVGGLKEAIEHNKTGLVVNKTELNPEGIRNAIVYFFQNDLQTACVELIRKENQEKSWKVFAEQIVLFAKSIKSSS